MDKFRLLVMLVLLSFSRYAAGQVSQFISQSLPDSPSHAQRHSAKTPKMFWVMSGALTASMVFDAETTTANMRAGAHEIWSPVLYGRQPGRARFYSVSFALDGAVSFASFQMVRMDHNKWRVPKNVWKVAGWGLMVYQTQDHLRGGVHNIQVRRKSK